MIYNNFFLFTFEGSLSFPVEDLKLHQGGKMSSSYLCPYGLAHPYIFQK